MFNINKFLSLAWRSAKSTVGNDHGWVQLAIAGVAAAGAIASALSDKGSTVGGAKFTANTVSGNTTNDVDFLFDVEATQAMTNLTRSMNNWGMQDRTYFKQVFEPFQTALIKSNQALLPDIVANSGASLQSNLKAIMGGDMLQEAFTNLAKQTGGDLSRFSADFGQMVDQIPTAEQRVGQAVSGLEQQFGKAGAELKRQMGAKGMDVSEAGLRQMALGKATSKSSVTDQANQMARTEKLDALERGIGVQSAVQESQTSMLDASRKTTQAGVDLTPQIGGVQETESLSAAGEAGVQMTASQADKMLGQRSDTKTATFVEKGTETPRFFDKDTGEIVAANGMPVGQAEYNRLQKEKAFAASVRPQGQGAGGYNYDGSGVPGGYDGGPGVSGASGQGSSSGGLDSGGFGGTSNGLGVGTDGAGADAAAGGADMGVW